MYNKKQKNYRKNFNYYYISKPLERNKDSGNFSIQNWMLRNFNKDFIFEGFDPETGEYIIKVLPKEYVKKHSWLHWDYQEQEQLDGTIVTTKVPSYYHLISFDSIKKYTEPNNLPAYK